MRYCKVIFILMLLLCGTGIIADGGSDPAAATADPALIETCRIRVTGFLGATICPAVPSAVAMVVNRDGIIFSAGEKASIDTPFGIASLSKVFTSIIILSLVDEGRISLSDPVKHYVPDAFICPPAMTAGEVTVGQLLAHNSGIPAWSGNTQPLPLLYPGGTCYEYANAGYCLLKKVIEKVSGEKYEKLVVDRIFNPLGMSMSGAECSNGTGGIVSTARDISRFAVMLINNGKYNGKRIISEESFRIMLAPTLPMPPGEDDYYYSLGWEVIKKDGRVMSFYKAGRWYNEGSALEVFPHLNAAVVYLCNPPNHRAEDYMQWRNSLIGILYNSLSEIYHDNRIKRTWPLCVKRDPAFYQGVYTDNTGKKNIEVFINNGCLTVKNDRSIVPLTAFSSLRYLDQNGHLYSFVWQEGRMKALVTGNRYHILQQ